MIDVFEAIKSRRSIRKFKSTPLARETLELLLDAARWAPSGGNLQPWIFIVVTNEATRAALARAAYEQEFVAQAPAVIAVVAAPPENSPYGERGRTLYCLQDTAAAVQNVLLTAYALGLGTCWVGAFDEGAVAAVLGVGPGERPVALIPVGEPAQKRTSTRKPLAEVVRWME
jgi:nitroreductase